MDDAMDKYKPASIKGKLITRKITPLWDINVTIPETVNPNVKLPKLASRNTRFPDHVIIEIKKRKHRKAKRMRA